MEDYYWPTKYNRHNNQLMRFFLGRVNNDVNVAEELTQRTWVKAFGSIGSYNPSLPFISWLFGIARHVLSDYFKERSASSDIPIESVTPELVAETQPLPEKEAEDNEIIELLLTSLQHLDPQELFLLFMRHLHGSSFLQIGETLGISKDAARHKTKQTLRKLKINLQKEVDLLYPNLLQGLQRLEDNNFLLSKFGAGHFKQPDKLVKRLRDANSTQDCDLVSLYLKHQLSEPFQHQIDAYKNEEDISKDFLNTLVEEFNRLLTIPFYQADIFAMVQLSEKTKRSFSFKDLSGEKLSTMNRLILEDIYADEIAKSLQRL